MCDSKEITDKTRQEIWKAIQSSKPSNIIITHGTDTIVQTAKYLSDKDLGNKKVVLVGAFCPLTFHPSDAPFNLGFAIGVIEHIKSGVYIAMNAQLFTSSNVEKDFSKLKFVELD
jgi:L-asparaginase